MFQCLKFTYLLLKFGDLAAFYYIWRMVNVINECSDFNLEELTHIRITTRGQNITLVSQMELGLTYFDEDEQKG